MADRVITPRRTRSGFLLLCVLILFAAFALRVWNLGTQSLWHDEGWSVFAGYTPFAPMGIRGADLNAPALWYLSLGIWQRLAGDAVWTMRYWSVLWSVLTVAVGMRLARRWFGNTAALLSGLFLAFNPILFVFSQEIRAYVAMPLMALILLGLAEQLLKPLPRTSQIIPRRIWIWLLLLELCTLYMHNLSVPIVAWLNVTVGAVWLLRRDWRRLVLWGVSQAGLLAAYWPWLRTQAQTGTPLNSPPRLNLSLAWDIWQSYFTGIKAMLGADSILAGLIALMGLVVLIVFVVMVIGGLLRPSSPKARWVWLILSQVALLPIFQLAIILAAHIDFHPRYFILGVPATLLLLAAGIAGLSRPERRKGLIIGIIGTVPRFATVALIAGLALALMARMGWLLYSSPIYQHDDFRAIAERYARLGADDRIVIPYQWEPSLDYYSHKMGFKAQFVEIPLHSSAEMIIARLSEALKGAKRIEVLTWYQLPADVRGAYSCLLGALGQHAENVVVSGIRSDRYEDFTAFDPAKVFAREQMPFGGMLSDKPAAYWGTGGLCLVTNWATTVPMPENWRLSARLYNHLNETMGQSDSDIMNDSQRPTSLWRQDERGTTFTLIPMPPSSPPQNFNAYFSTYSAANPQQGFPSLWVAQITKPVINQDVELAPTDQELAKGVYLRAAEIPSIEQLEPGTDLPVTLEWRFEGAPPKTTVFLTLDSSDGGEIHSLMSQLILPEQNPERSYWLLHIPANAQGRLALKVKIDESAHTLGEYTVREISRTMIEPDMPLAGRVSAHFKDAGILIGATVPDTISADKPLQVTLLWQAESTPGVSYTVFVHLRDAAGNIIAQSDSQPADGARATTNWLSGEYITDLHTLTWNRTDYHGAATLAVGLYDPATGKRVLLSGDSAADLVVLPISLTVK